MASGRGGVWQVIGEGCGMWEGGRGVAGERGGAWHVGGRGVVRVRGLT